MTSNRENFLASFDNDSNGGAKIIEESENVILGFLGNFGYAVFQKKNQYFEAVTDFSDIETSMLHFLDKKDQTLLLHNLSKISLIPEINSRNYMSEYYHKLLKDLKHFESWIRIQASVLIDIISKMSLTELIHYSEDQYSLVRASNVYWDKFLIVH